MTQTQISITANGKPFELDAGIALINFIEQLKLSPERVVVEYNKAALSPHELSDVTLKNGDALEIVRIVAGG